MNLFRSEEHARRWPQFDPAYETNLQPLTFWAERFSAARFKARSRTDYFSWCAERPTTSPADQSAKKER